MERLNKFGETKSTMRFILYTLLASCFFNAAFSQSDNVPNEKTRVFLKTFRDDFIRAIQDKKTDRLSPYHADDIRLMPEFQKTVLGKRNVAAYYQAFLSRFDVQHYTRTEIEVHDLGAQVLEIGLFTSKMKLNSTGTVYDVAGKYFAVWKKSSNGTLSLVTEAWNYNHALEIEDQLRFAGIPAHDVALMPHLPITNSLRFELAALNRLMEATVSQHDASIWSQFYTPDGMFCYSRQPMYLGKKELDAFLDDHCKHLVVFEKLDIRHDTIEPLGKYVLEYASHIAVWRGGEYSGVGLGKDLRLWRREADGSLKIFRHIAMYD
jgi:ketosteroid isomerase-like protein